MKFVYGKRDWPDRKRGQENGYLLTNGLGGFSSGSMINSNTRNDHSLLMAALTAPNVRYNMVNRLEEALDGTTSEAPDKTTEGMPSEATDEATEGTPSEASEETMEGMPSEAPEETQEKTYLSGQEFEDPSRNENGYLCLNCFTFEDYPEWTFQADGVEVVKRLVMRQGENLVAVEYQIDNRTDREVCLTVTPHLQFVPKGKELEGEPEFEIKRLGRGGLCRITSNGLSLFFRTDGEMETVPSYFCGGMFYAYDACDGRSCLGRTCVNHRIRRRVPAHRQQTLEIIYLAESDRRKTAGNSGGQPGKIGNCTAGNENEIPAAGTEERLSKRAGDGTAGNENEIPAAEIEKMLPRRAGDLFREAREYRNALREAALRHNPGLRDDETALQLVMSASQFIAERESTGGKTILAGYPFFEDWGRDTMIALEGCCMAAGQPDTAKSILRTFAGYCRNGLMPNLFPEGGRKPMYNTADAALLFINGVYRYYERTKDKEFVREMWPVMEEIVNAYRAGTDYGIRMDEDGLVAAGRELDQVTWMDVRIGDFLPTPRHGKPVEINAYWYSALRAMEQMKGVEKEAEAGKNREAGGNSEAREAGNVCKDREACETGKAGRNSEAREDGNGGKDREACGTGNAWESGNAGEGKETGEGGGDGPKALTGDRSVFDYGGLAKKVRDSFREKFWMEEKGYLKDVVSGEYEGDAREAVSGGDEGDVREAVSGGDEGDVREAVPGGDEGDVREAVSGSGERNGDTRFRCNQIWAVSMPFTMLDREQEIRIVDAVYEKLYTPLGLRTLDREDPDFHATYGGPVQERDRAYHQGTVWVFPLGAYYLAFLKTRDYSAEAMKQVRRQLQAMESALAEGCIGQLPEIYDGEYPAYSKGCFAQAWSVGEILRVYEELARHEG